VLLLLALGAAAQQAPPAPPQRDPIEPELSREAGSGTIVVKLGLATGLSVPYQVEVRLLTGMGFQITSQRVQKETEIVFRGMSLGEYIIEVTGPGFATTRDQAVLWYRGAVTYVYINLLPESAQKVLGGAAGFPVLAPKARKQTEKGLKALRENHLAEAEKKLAEALKMAPGHPYVNFLLGLVYLRLNQLEPAGELLGKATTLAPDFAPAQEAMGALLRVQGNHQGAVAAFDRAIVLNPDRAELHLQAGMASFDLQRFEQALAYARRALELAAEGSAEAQLLAGFSLARLGRREEAVRELESLIARFPGGPAAGAAQKALERLRDESPATARAQPPASLELEARGAASGRLLEVEARGQPWLPPDVDAFKPPVREGVACPAAEVLRETGQTVQRLPENLTSIGATELIVHSELDADGYEHRQGTARFEYIANIRETRPGHLVVEEYRQGNNEGAPARIFTQGVAAMALIFHPYYSGDFDINCEGLGQWQGEPAWQVHFQQKDQLPSRILVYRSEGRVVPLAQKGRAWIGANSYQILRIESDLVQPMSEVGLQMQHLVIEYAPVAFRDGSLQIWLPSKLGLHAQVRGRRMRHQHSFSEFVLFSVETEQKIRAPQTPPR